VGGGGMGWEGSGRTSESEVKEGCRGGRRLAEHKLDSEAEVVDWKIINCQE
jgi:hypothetical protein